MTTEFNYQTSFILDKAHFGECFDESVINRPMTVKYRKAAILAVIGLLLLFVVGTNHYAAFFVVVLAAVEALGVFYKKTWWLWRQMVSKAYNHEVKLRIDAQGITTESFHVNNVLLFEHVTQIKESDAGLLLTHKKGVNYVSKSCLSDDAIEFLQSKA
jgi:hypothetical protein